MKENAEDWEKVVYVDSQVCDQVESKKAGVILLWGIGSLGAGAGGL